MNEPLVSIIIPIYNMGEKLKSSIKHVLNQTYQNLEVLLVDDGSTDNTLDVCNRLAEFDRRIKVFHQENQGSGPARNLAIANSSGKYAFFSDADDELSENAIERLVGVFNNNDCDLIVFGYRIEYSFGKSKVFDNFPNRSFDGGYVRRNYNLFIDKKNWQIYGALWNKLFDLDVIRNNNIVFPPMKRHQDEVFVLRYIDVAQKIMMISDVFYTYYHNDMNKAFSKFPINYFDMVSEFNANRIKYIIDWNPDNKEAVNILSDSFINYTTKSLMHLFNPKWNMSFSERYRRVKDIARRCVDEMPDKNYKSNSTMYKLMKKERYFALYFVVRLALFKYKNDIG